MSIASRLLFQANRILWLDSLRQVGARIEDFTVISFINQFYGVYGYATALALSNPQGQLVLIFGGTDDLSDVVADIQSAVQTPWPDVDPSRKAQFAYGLFEVFRTVFIPWINTFIPTLRTARGITLLGHSAGGSSALFAGMLLKIKFNITSVMYIYAAPIFGNLAAKQLMERTGLEIYDVTAENDPIPGIKLPWAYRIGNGATAPQRNYILTGPVTEPKLITDSKINWFVNPAYASRHFLSSTYIPSLQNILALENGGAPCTYNKSAIRNDPNRRCATASTMCVKNGKLVPCGVEGWCGSNGTCVAKFMPYNCNSPSDCTPGNMCMTPGYHWPSSTWDSKTEQCKSGATCATNPWDLQKYCWNK
jgi:hypothetical protein